MDAKKITGSYMLSNLAVMLHGYLLANDNKVFVPPSSVSIIMTAYYEKDEFLEASMKSIREQNVLNAFPDFFEFILVGCEGVNLDIAKKYADRIICLVEEKGKLYARDVAIRNAEGEIIVAVDSDCIYPVNWLNAVLKPFHDENVVAVTTPPTLSIFHEADLWLAIPHRIFFMNRMLGRGSAFRKKAYFDVGGFDVTVKGTSSVVAVEEEINFYNRLRNLGKIKFVNVPHIHLGIGEERLNRGLRLSQFL